MPAMLPERRQLAGDVADVVLAALDNMSTRTKVRYGAAITAAAILARSRMPALVAVWVAVGIGYAAERAYVFGHDVHLAAIAIQGYEAAPGEDHEV